MLLPPAICRRINPAPAAGDIGEAISVERIAMTSTRPGGAAPQPLSSGDPRWNTIFWHISGSRFPWSPDQAELVI